MNYSELSTDKYLLQIATVLCVLCLIQHNLTLLNAFYLYEYYLPTASRRTSIKTSTGVQVCTEVAQQEKLQYYYLRIAQLNT